MKNLSPESIACLATALANELACGKDIEEINVLKNIGAQVVATLSTIISQRILIEIKNKKQDKP